MMLPPRGNLPSRPPKRNNEGNGEGGEGDGSMSFEEQQLDAAFHTFQLAALENIVVHKLANLSTTRAAQRLVPGVKAEVNSVKNNSEEILTMSFVQMVRSVLDSNLIIAAYEDINRQFMKKSGEVDSLEILQQSIKSRFNRIIVEKGITTGPKNGPTPSLEGLTKEIQQVFDPTKSNNNGFFIQFKDALLDLLQKQDEFKNLKNSTKQERNEVTAKVSKALSVDTLVGERNKKKRGQQKRQAKLQQSLGLQDEEGGLEDGVSSQEGSNQNGHHSTHQDFSQ